MFFRTLLAALAVTSVASAQMKDLASLLAGEPLLSELNTLLKGYPDIASTLAAAKNGMAMNLCKLVGTHN